MKMITIIRHLFGKKTTQKRVLEKVEVNIPFEKKSRSMPKKSRKSK